MTNKEIVQALRYCSDPDFKDCSACKCFRYGDCLERLVADAANLIERLNAENAALREKNWGCRQQMSEKLYGGYLTSVQNVREAKLELAKQAAQCVERAMLEDDMFLVKDDTVGWKVRIYRNEAENYVEELP